MKGEMGIQAQTQENDVEVRGQNSEQGNETSDSVHVGAMRL